MASRGGGACPGPRFRVYWPRKPRRRAVTPPISPGGTIVKRLSPCWLLGLLGWGGPAGPAGADGHALAAGQSLSLKADLVLTGDDVLEVRGTADKRCTVDGNGHRVRTAPGWRGHVRVAHCDLRGLG